MDYRKLSTEQLLMMGILHAPMPRTRDPDEFYGVAVDQYKWSETKLREGLNAGGLDAAMFYGCWRIWETDIGYSGQLLQYHKETDHFEDKDYQFALSKALEWADGCAARSEEMS
jgi:hypothetical protein